MIGKGGLSYKIPSGEKEEKIYGFKKWEEAFRIYAQIYMQQQTPTGDMRFGNIYTMSTQQQLLFIGTM